MERLLLWQTSSLPSLSPISILSGKLSSFCSLSLGGGGGGERGDHRTVDSFFPAICRGLGRERLPLFGSRSSGNSDVQGGLVGLHSLPHNES